MPPKANWSSNLADLFGNELDFLILLLSNIGITGGAGQANYAAGNTFQDGLAHHLTSWGLNCVSIDLPVIHGVGFVEERLELLKQLVSTGQAYMSEDELHATLDYHCRPVNRDVREAPRTPARHQVLPRFWLPQQSAEGVVQFMPMET